MSRTGKNLRMYREKLDLTQEELARRVGYADASMIQQIESGHKSPSLEKAQDLAVHLGITLSQLVGEAPPLCGVTNMANGNHQTVYQHIAGGTEWEQKLSAVLVAVLGTQRPLLVEAVREAVREVILDLRLHNGEER